MEINLYDDMNNLISNLKKHSAVTEFVEVNKEMHKEENKELLEMINSFQKVNVQINTAKMAGEEEPKELIEKSKEIYEEVLSSDLARKYFEKEMVLTNLVTELNTTFIQEVTNIYDDIK